MTTPNPLTVAVIGAGGKMGMRVSANLAKSPHTVRYSENGEAGIARVRAAGRELTPTEEAIKGADVVVLAVPDIALEAVTQAVVPQVDSGAVVLTLDPAAAYANLLFPREDIYYAVAHPCHPSVFFRRYTDEEWDDTFGGDKAGMDVVAAFEYDAPDQRAMAEQVIRDMYTPVLDVHWVTVKQLAQCEPTLVETVVCMLGDFMKEVMKEGVARLGIPEPAAKAIMLGHIQVSLANSFGGDNPYSDACYIAMQYGRDKIIKDDWTVIFEDAELDANLQKMLHLEHPIAR